MEISKSTSHGKTWTLVIGPNTVWTLGLLVTINFTTGLDDSLFFKLPIRLVVSRELECADFSATLLSMGQLP
jgi:hypothetical protein